MIAFVLNLPYTLVGLLVGIISFPTGIKVVSPRAVVMTVKKLWWAFGYMKGTRAATIGHVVLLGPSSEKGDLEHELVHVAQYERMPMIYPFLYYAELLRKGYRKNKYEAEAYRKAGNMYKGK